MNDSGEDGRRLCHKSYCSKSFQIPSFLLIDAWIVLRQCIAASLVFFGAAVSSMAGVLELRVVDDDARPIPCRVLVRDASGTCQTPEDAVVLEIGPDRWFMSSGSDVIHVAAGEYELRVERGLEYRRFKSQVDVSGPRTAQTVELARWVDMQARGYLCGENHLHVGVDSVGPMAVAEGLNFASSLTWWNGPDSRRPAPTGPGRSRVLEFAGHSVVASIHDAELEHAWGAAYVQFLPHPFPLSSDPMRPNFEFLRYARDHGAIIHYQAGWSREVGLDALLGLVDTVNVCNNNFHMHRFQPRSRYGNLLNVDGFPEYENTDQAMMLMNMETWYRLLNWGLKLPAGAGSATGVKQVPVGYNRAYVRGGRTTSLQGFYQAWRDGRNFVTNGPIILLRGAQGQAPGDEISLTHVPTAIEFQLDVLSDQPLEMIEVIQNGDVIESFPASGRRSVRRSFSVTCEQSCWIAARCMAHDDLLSDDELQQYDNPPRQRPSRLRFAHTSPIYIMRNGRPAIVRKSVEEGLMMLDKLREFSDEHAREDVRRAFRAAVQRGIDILRERGREAPS